MKCVLIVSVFEIRPIMCSQLFLLPSEAHHSTLKTNVQFSGKNAYQAFNPFVLMYVSLFFSHLSICTLIEWPQWSLMYLISPNDSFRDTSRSQRVRRFLRWSSRSPFTESRYWIPKRKWVPSFDFCRLEDVVYLTPEVFLLRRQRDDSQAEL